MKKFIKLSGIALLFLLLAQPLITKAQFSGFYDPANWTLVQLNGGNGSVNATGAPANIVLTGPNGTGSNSFTHYQIAVQTSGFITFTWNVIHNDPGFDGFGYSVNGVNTQLTSGSASSTTTVPVNAGDMFSFYGHSFDGCCGTFNSTISNFSNTTTPPPPPPGPCDNITTIADCGISQTVSFSGTGQWNTTACGFSTPGQEQIFSFTPTVTGMHTLNLTGGSSAWVDWFWQAGSCAQTGWNCIDDVFGTGSFFFGPLNAGTTYYILADPEGTTSITKTFDIGCPQPAPPNDLCIDVTPIAITTGVPQTFTGNTVGATPDGPLTLPTVWHAFTLTQCSDVTIDYCANSPALGDVWIVLSLQCPVSPFLDATWLFANSWQQNCGNGNWTINYFNLQPGTYWLPVMGAEPGFNIAGPYTVTLNSVACPPPWDPCANIDIVPSCGTNVTANMSGTGSWTGLGPFGTPGQERIFEFTPTSSGIHQINVTGATGGCWVDFFWKPASGGCVPSGWNFIIDNCGIGTFGSLNMTAGTTYYILLDPESTGSFSRTFNVTCPAAPPANDLCADAITVTCGGTYTGNTMLADNTDNPAFFCGTGASTAGGVWYKFIGNGDQVTASLCGSSYDTKLFVYEGSCGNFTCVNGNDDNLCNGFFTLESTVIFTSNIGTDYYILVAGFGSSTGAFTLNITCAPPPPNPCNTSTIISNCGIPQTASFSGNGSWNTTSCGFSTFGQEYIYEFVAPATGNYTISVTSSTGGWVDYFWKTGSCSEFGWTCLGDVFSAGATLPYFFNPSFTLTAGQTAYIQLSAEGTGAVTQTFVINCPVPPPANDLCIDAIPVTCGQTITGNTSSATSETGLPSCPTFSYNGISNGVWYVLAGNGQTAIASLCGSSYDTWINVYEGTDCNNLTCIAGNDDFCGLSSEVTFGTTIGMNYYILVSGFSNSSGAFTLNVTCCNPPANDLCSSVTPVTLTPGVYQTFTGNSQCAAAEGILNLPTVWHAITTTTTTNLTISYCGNSPAQGTIYIVLGTLCPASQNIGDYIFGTFEFSSCGDGNGTITYSNLPAGTYYIPVGGSPMGPYTINVIAECVFTASITSSQSGTCNLVNLSANASVPGNYTYAWTGAGIVNATTQSTQAQVPATGLYEVSISDAFGCTATASTTIEFDDGPDINLTASQTLICGTGTVQLDAGFGVAAQNGFAGAYAPGTWVFSNIPGGTGGSVNTAGAPASITIISGNNGIAGTSRFEHVVTAGGNISFNWTYTTVDGANWDRPMYSINGVSTLMPGYNTGGSTSQNGTANIPVVAGQMFGLEMFTVDGAFGPGQVVISNIVFPGFTPGLLWSPAGNLNDATINNPVATMNATETFTVVATDPNSSCTSSSSITIYVDPVPTPVISPSGTLSICNGGSLTVSTQYLAGDNYTFAWGGLAVPSETFNVSAFGDYFVLVTSPNGCESDPVNFTVYETTVFEGSPIIDSVSCYGGNDGQVELVALGALTNPGGSIYLGPFDYSMNGGPLQSSPVFSGLSAGTNTFAIHDPVSGCSVTFPVTVYEPSLLSGSTSVLNGVSCFGGSNGTATAQGSGGVGPYTYNWLTPIPKQVQTNDEIPAGTWTVVIEDANGCTATATVTITQPPLLTVSLGPDRVVPWGTANGFTASGCTNIIPVIAGGTTPYTSYSWSTGATTATLNNICKSADGVFTYTVTVTDANGCTASSTVTLIWSGIDCSNNTNGTKIQICMVPPGNPGNCQTVCIAVAAVPALLANTPSYIGACNPGCAPARIMAPEATTDNISVNLLPNPTTGQILVDFASESQSASSIVVTDLQGRVVMNVALDGSSSFTKELDMSILENGLYILNIMNNEGLISTTRVVKAN